MQDPFGNYLARVVFPESTKFLQVEVDLIAEIHTYNPFDFFIEEDAKNYPFSYEPSLKKELAPYFEIVDQGPLLKQLVSSINTKDFTTVDLLVDINRRLNQELKYLIRMEAGVQTSEQTLEKGSGSCRDQSWLLCQILRHLGFATRFASGYLVQLVPDEIPVDGPKGTSEDFTDLHAWTEVYLPGAGWIGLDPTSGLITGEGHIPLCCTPSPSSAAPITGVLEPCESTLEFKMELTRIYEPAKSTKPYTDYEWSAIDRLGQSVEQRLQGQDVRLTMGGEPTFVSDESRQSSEWHLDALGKEKYEAGLAMMGRLKGSFAPHGLIHYGQGKWYPGEPLPRWSLNCFWRKDGLALPKALAETETKARAMDQDTSRLFLETLCESLALDTHGIIPAYEDVGYVLWREHRLPFSAELKDKDLGDKEERRRIQKMVDHGLQEPVGYVLPLLYSGQRDRWLSNLWRFSNDRMFLTVGDSPVGLRLPLNLLPYIEAGNYEEEVSHSPMEPHDPLPPPSYFENLRLQRVKGGSLKSQQDLESDKSGLVRTALTAEVRDGELYIFMPPIKRLERWIDLVNSIEKSAASLNISYKLEGYPPPQDDRLENFKVTPDPGVLEINVQPAASWQELSHITETVYEEARLAKLSPYKFLIDGRKVGSGGGNHMVLGGKTPSDSPFLRRPDLLRSMISYWQHHPSLSYLFSSLYIGPTSQAPRIDEARHESLYEMEIAFQKITPFAETPLWMVDRLFRNLLVDITGNTHRAEFCIDKLYSPDGNTGRLGLLELRNFEMPPHPQMALLQSLLVRALICRFWEQPYAAPLKRWSTSLHDRFMLSHYLWQDFKEVISGLNEFGLPMELSWFRPHLEFRFPKIGSVRVEGLELELRSALEPWPVMGEEQLMGGISRAVDATVERVELVVRGALPSYRQISCNGIAVPLTPTEDKDTHVAGVRFKAWQEPSSYHPHLACQSPLVFDVFDTHLNRSIGGFTYHVSHPGGRSFDNFPVNENEAEGRRLARFEHRHSSIQHLHQHEGRNPDYPLTLDLRRFASRL